MCPDGAKMTCRKIPKLDLEVLILPTCDPGSVPSDYQLFRTLKQHLWDKWLDNQDQLEIEVSQLFSSGILVESHQEPAW